ncbi:cation:proton antiporter [Methyloversatilis thermotolerans]|uniref:cation:proton antiporter n=1 Tax=Methyloversatilis thermotolerans TaxID=1346290 RepID=UPI00037B8442|nr:cation:proton antiporter [Methyloversatilis thermotolerans]
MIFEAGRMFALVGWPAVLLAAWLAGEIAHRGLGVPRVCAYSLAGIVYGSWGGMPDEPEAQAAFTFLANFSLGLFLFELGHRINLRWLVTNPWIAITGIVESLLTFFVVRGVALALGQPDDIAMVIGALSVATSPAALVRVVNDMRGSGQVTERALHLCAINCLLSVLLMKVAIGYWQLLASGSATVAVWNSLVIVAVSVGCGILVGLPLPRLLRLFRADETGVTIVFALAVMLVTLLTQGVNVSPLLAALTLGVLIRRRHHMLTPAQRNFGVLGDLLTVFLFVYVAGMAQWPSTASGLALAVLLSAGRIAAKMSATALFAHVSGTSTRKGALSGLALAPLSTFALLLLEYSRHAGFGLADGALAAIAGMMIVMEFIGPVCTQWALRLAGESRRKDMH